MPRDAEASAPSPIHETENALIISVPVSRREDRMNFTRNGFVPLLFFGFLAYYLSQEESIFGGLLGIYVAARFLYITLNLIIGKELLEITQESITVSYGLALFKRSQKYHAHWIERLRYDQTTFNQSKTILPPKNGPPQWEAVVDTTSYALLCDYDGETTSLLGWLDKPLAKEILQRIKIRFPSYRV